MIQKQPAPHLMRVVKRFSLAINAKTRLRGDNAYSKNESAMAIHRAFAGKAQA
jgi:hypothetical protein